MNFLNQGIPLGRWFRIAVILHWSFLIYAAYQIFGDANDPNNNVLDNSLYIFLLFGTVLLHEFGHALSCRAVGGEAFQIILWPLGGMAFVQPPMTPTAWLITTVCGPLVNAILWPVFWFLFYHWVPTIIDPAHPTTISLYLASACWYLYQINRGLLLFNLIPAYPMDGGRLLQELLWYVVGYRNSLMAAGMVGTIAGGGFIVLGLGLRSIDIPYLDFHLGGGGDIMLVFIGLLCCMQSFGIYRRAQEIASWRKN